MRGSPQDLDQRAPSCFEWEAEVKLVCSLAVRKAGKKEKRQSRSFEL
jgi:hypothetical protein